MYKAKLTPLNVHFNIDDLPPSCTPLAPTTKERQRSETIINFLIEKNRQRQLTQKPPVSK